MRTTRIRARHIEALESGDYSKLPPDVYVRGFLKNYSSFLKLDEAKVLKLYRKERGLAENVKKVTEPKTPIRTRKKLPRVVLTPKRIIIGSAILVALAIIGYIGWEVSILAAPPKLTIDDPADNSKVTEQAIIVSGSTDAGNDVSINDVPIGVDPSGTFKEKVSLQSGVNLIRVKAKNKLGKVAQLDRTVLAELADLTQATRPDCIALRFPAYTTSADCTAGSFMCPTTAATPRKASGISAMMISALKMIADRMALCGLDRFMTLSTLSCG